MTSSQEAPVPGLACGSASRLGLVLLVLSGCGTGESGPARVRLVECAGRLHDVEPGAPTELLREDFEAVPQGWHVITGTKDGLAAAADALRARAGREEGRTFLTLAGHGALYRVIAVEGGAPYLFRGALRARGVAPARTPFFGARFWVAESSRSGAPEELFGGAKRFDLLHPVATAAGETGWQERHIAFRTREGTRTLIVGCVLAVDEPLDGGEVDFDDLYLARIAEPELWELEAAEAVAEAHRGAELPRGDDWRARRSLGAMLAGEQRPAILCLPGERLELELHVPEGDPVLECALAPWPASHRPGPEPLVAWLRVEGRELLRETLALGPLAETAWREVALGLAPFAGERVALELGFEGPVPGLFGAPLVRARGAAAAGWNVLLVSIDTLRADRVGAYGATSGATPRLDALANGALVFEDVTANAPYTLPAHATLFSGQFPSVHGVEDRDRLLAPVRSPVLARILAARGYRTQAFAAGGFLTPAFGFHAGFDGFAIADPLRHAGSRYFDEFRREYPEQSPAGLLAEPGIERVRRWLAAHAAEPFFLFLHTYEVHDYDPPPGTTDCAARGCASQLADFRQLLFPKRTDPFPGSPEDRAHLGHLYDAALRHVDGQLGLLLDDLERLGLRERTLVVVTSDHGEELFERGRLQHGKSLYEEVLKIPLIVRVPARGAARVRAPAMQVDVAPTILGALGLAPDARMQGVDLLRATPLARAIFSEVDDHFARKSSLREGSWKLVHGPRDAAVTLPNEREWELYDLARDPGEARESSQADPERLARLQRQLEALQERLRALGEALGPLEAELDLDEGTRRLLEHLGY